MPSVFSTALTLAVVCMNLFTPNSSFVDATATPPTPTTTTTHDAYSHTKLNDVIQDGKGDTASIEQRKKVFTFADALGTEGDDRYQIRVQALPYSYDHLEPIIDKETMMIHYEKHHKGYATKYNNFIREMKSKYPTEFAQRIAPLDFLTLVTHLELFPAEYHTGIKNNLGGVINHGMFWPSLRAPSIQVGGNTPDENNNLLAQAIIQQYGSFEEFKTQFTTKALDLFGSGWTWLNVNCHHVNNNNNNNTPNKDANNLHHFKLQIDNLPNQDFPTPALGVPVMNLDVFEHAYYLKYRNDRAGYVKGVWDLWNWEVLEERYVYACLNENKGNFNQIKDVYVSRQQKK